MELVYLCTGQTVTSVAVRKHTQEATAKTVKALVSRTIFSKIFLAFRIWFLLSHHSSSFYFTLTGFDKHKFFPIIINFLRCSSISVDNDCSCSSGPEGKQRCKIGQLIFHLQVNVAWNSFPRLLYRIYIKNLKKATFPLRSQRKFTRVHKMIKVWSNGVSRQLQLMYLYMRKSRYMVF